MRLVLEVFRVYDYKETFLDVRARGVTSAMKTTANVQMNRLVGIVFIKCRP